MEGGQIRTSKESRSAKSKRSEKAAYHRRRTATFIHLEAKLKILIDLEDSDHLHSMEKICHIHLEGGDAAGVKSPGHIANAVATPLQRMHPAAEPSGHQVGSNKSLTHQLGDPRHPMVNVGITFIRLLRP